MRGTAHVRCRGQRECPDSARYAEFHPRERLVPSDTESMGMVQIVRAELVERFRGRWVALDDAGDVVADAEELGALLECLESSGIHAHVVQRVPAADDPMFVGLS